MEKETYSATVVYGAKETYLHGRCDRCLGGKRDLLTRQKRPTYTTDATVVYEAKETYSATVMYGAKETY